METSVCVLVGNWTSVNNGSWKFVTDTGLMARSVEIKEGMSFMDLIESIQSEFKLGSAKLKVKSVSYMFPIASSFLAVEDSPPVCIETDMGLKIFINMKRECVGLNLFVSVETATQTSVDGQNLNLVDNISLDVIGRQGVLAFEDLIPDDLLIAHAEASEAQLEESRRSEGVYAECSTGTSCTVSEDEETEKDEEVSGDDNDEDNETEFDPIEEDGGERGFESDGFELCSDNDDNHSHDMEERVHLDYPNDYYFEGRSDGEGTDYLADALMRMHVAESASRRGGLFEGFLEASVDEDNNGDEHNSDGSSNLGTHEESYDEYVSDIDAVKFPFKCRDV